MIFEIVNSGHSLNFSNMKFLEFYKLEIFIIFQIYIFWNFSDSKFFEFSKFGNFKIFAIVQIGKLTNF